MGRLDAKRAILAGGANGLGAAAARKFVEELRNAGGSARFVAGDVLDVASIRGAIDQASAEMGGIDACVASAGELGRHGIRVNAIGPAYVKTGMLAATAQQAVGDDLAAQEAWYDQRAAQLPLGALPTPLDIANTALFLCSDEASSFTGSILHPDGGMTSTTGGG